jgi:hypothetical protein
MTSSSSRPRKRPQSMNVWAVEEIRTLRSLAEQGLSPQSIALALGRPRAKIPRQPRKPRRAVEAHLHGLEVEFVSVSFSSWAAGYNIRLRIAL